MSERIDRSAASEDTSERLNIRVPQPLPTGTARAEREVDFARRALLQAGWTVPVVIAAGLPRTAHAITPVPHTDNPHVDTPHTDGPHTDHADTPHVDSPHSDATHTDHSDTAHTDTSHTDHSDTVASHTDITEHTDVTFVTTENDNGGDNDNGDDDDDDDGSSHTDVVVRQISSGESGESRFSTIPPIRPPSNPGVMSASPTSTPTYPGVASAPPPAATRQPGVVSAQPVGTPPVAVARPTPSVLPQAGEAGPAAIRPYAFAGLGLIAAGIGLRVRRWFVRGPQGPGGGDADPGGQDTESNTDSTLAP